MNKDNLASGNEIGKRIREKRKLKGLTQEQLAQMIHMSDSNISHYEKYANKISYRSLSLIANALDTSVKYLLIGEPISERAEAIKLFCKSPTSIFLNYDLLKIQYEKIFDIQVSKCINNASDLYNFIYDFINNGIKKIVKGKDVWYRQDFEDVGLDNLTDYIKNNPKIKSEDVEYL